MSNPILVVGVDEAGRGPLCAPVFSAAVILCHPLPLDLEEITDSKNLSPKKRERLASLIHEHCVCGIGQASVEEIDNLNIRNATFLAMRRAVAALPVVPSHIRVDGNVVPPGLPCSAEAIIGGDGLCRAIGAASIIAKVARDALMIELDKAYPGYGWAKNSGYGTKAHLEAIRELGITEHHRRSFRGVKEWVPKQQPRGSL